MFFFFIMIMSFSAEIKKNGVIFFRKAKQPNSFEPDGEEHRCQQGKLRQIWSYGRWMHPNKAEQGGLVAHPAYSFCNT